jgi:uncharacterized protein YuzE
MRLAYDAQADVLRLEFRDGAVESSKEIVHRVIVNLDAAGEAVGVDLLEATRWIGRTGLSQIAIELQDLWSEGRRVR